MAKLHGEEGAALVTALLLTLLSLVIATALLYVVAAGTRSSASHKRYSSALAAAEGGVEVLANEIVPELFRRMLTGPLTDDKLDDLVKNSPLKSLSLDFAKESAQCLQQKLSLRTEQWSACSAEEKTGDPALTPDVAFTLLGTEKGKSYRIATKIVDTIPGNSFLGGIDLDAGGSVDWKDESVHPQHVPYLYSIGVQGVTVDAREKARISVLYAY